MVVFSPTASRSGIMPETAGRGESPGQRDEAGDRDLLGARRRAKTRRRNQARHVDAQRAQALAQHFPPLSEGGLGYRLEDFAVTGKRGCPRRDLYQRDVTLGGGTNAEALTAKRMRAVQRHCTSTERRP